MLDKLAEMVREQTVEAEGKGSAIHCAACNRKPYRSSTCTDGWYCPDISEPDGSLMMARWAVLLVAKGLEYGYEDYLKREMPEWKQENYYKASRQQYMEMGLHDLIAEVEEGSNGGAA